MASVTTTEQARALGAKRIAAADTPDKRRAMTEAARAARGRVADVVTRVDELETRLEARLAELEARLTAA